jgi:hypothetical protein
MPMFERGCVVLLLISVSACGGSTTAPTPSTPTVASLSILGSPVAEITGAGVQGYQFLALVQYSNLTSADVTTSATWTVLEQSNCRVRYVYGETYTEHISAWHGYHHRVLRRQDSHYECDGFLASPSR